MKPYQAYIILTNRENRETSKDHTLLFNVPITSVNKKIGYTAIFNHYGANPCDRQHYIIATIGVLNKDLTYFNTDLNCIYILYIEEKMLRMLLSCIAKDL